MSKKEKSLFRKPTDVRGGCFRKQAHPKNAEEGQGWEEAEVCDTLNVFDYTELRTPILIVEVINE